MRALENSLPIEELNRVALAEGNAKKPVYQMHKWWARRLGSVFRLITLSSFIPGSIDGNKVWQMFCEGVDPGGKLILDPFMGGGTTVVEALRLGCRVIGLDINPVAWFTTKKQIETVDLEELQAAFQRLDQTVGKRIRSYYKTRCPQGHPAERMYYFSVKIAKCTRCHRYVSLFPNYELSRDEHEITAVCPKCYAIVNSKRTKNRAQCPDCGYSYDPRRGNAGRGSYTCGHCGQEDTVLEAVRRLQKPLPPRLYAIEG
ncbi:MAG: DNA methyltransferase [Gemmatales bacterium]|nr:DNA methyltransferase [Gemmatales bacterium]MDW8222943.1 DNA methyltransferase [Gemmatales bacterium]